MSLDPSRRFSKDGLWKRKSVDGALRSSSGESIAERIGPVFGGVTHASHQLITPNDNDDMSWQG
jgi:hypothetical protein